MNAIVANYTEDVIWSIPDGTTRGHEELNEGAHKLLDRTPDSVLTAAGPVHVLRDLGYLAFTYRSASAAARVPRLRRGDGRIAALYTLRNGFTDRE
jgi:hypothetical protein